MLADYCGDQCLVDPGFFDNWVENHFRFDDIAHQRGTLMSLPMWRELIFPHHERFNRRVHELGGRIMYHSCGSVMDAVPGLIEMGIDVLDILQFSADNMVPEHLNLSHRLGDMKQIYAVYATIHVTTNLVSKGHS